MSDNDKGIPSPFPTGSVEPELIAVLDRLFKSYGYDEIAFFCSKRMGEDESAWFGSSSTVSEGMIDYIKKTSEFMEDYLDNHEEDGNSS
jgi:hypothetical protein